jgi:hypothetical protein
MEMRVSVLGAVGQLKFFNEIINLATRSLIKKSDYRKRCVLRTLGFCCPISARKWVWMRGQN